MPLKRKKKLALVYFSHFGDPLGGHLGFRGEVRDKTIAHPIVLQLHILNYHKIKQKSGIPKSRWIPRSMQENNIGQRPLFLDIYFHFGGQLIVFMNYSMKKNLINTIELVVHRNVYFNIFIVLHLKGIHIVRMQSFW